VTDLDRLSALVRELQGNDHELQTAFGDERDARAEVLSGLWRIVEPVIYVLANHTVEHADRTWHLLETPVYPERGSMRSLFLAACEDGEDFLEPKFVLGVADPDGLTAMEFMDARSVCEVGHRWRLADLADALEDRLLRAVNGKMQRRATEARERAEVLKAVATLLRKVKG